MNHALVASKELTILANKMTITTWHELVDFVRKLPYSRNKNRHDLSLVLKEKKGSCSSKHALLKAIANENNISDVKLILGIYKMHHLNTNIGTTLINKNLQYIPEAHCYLKINEEYLDVTSKNASFSKIKKDLLQEIVIKPEQVINFKVNYHKEFLKKWIQTEQIHISFDELWKIRESCINYLSQQSVN